MGDASCTGVDAGTQDAVKGGGGRGEGGTREGGRARGGQVVVEGALDLGADAVRLGERLAAQEGRWRLRLLRRAGVGGRDQPRRK